MLRVTLIDEKGKQYTAFRVVKVFNEAVEAAAYNGGTYKLTEDLTLYDYLALDTPAGKKFTLDLNQRKLTAEGITIPNDGSDITFKNGDLDLNKDISMKCSNSSVTFDGVDLNSTTDVAIRCGENNDPNYKNNTIKIVNSTITSPETGIILFNKNVLDVEGSTINHGYFGITQSGNYTGSNVKVVNTQIAGKYSGIYLSNQATGATNILFVDNGTISSTDESPIEVKKTNITVKNSALTSTAATQSYSVNPGGSNGVGYGIMLAGYAVGTAYEGTYTFDNNSFTLPGASKIVKYNGTGNNGLDVIL